MGMICNLSTNIVLMQVEKVDKEKNLIIYRKVKDLKGVHPTDLIKHNIGRGGYNPREWQYIMEWAEVGKTAVFCHNGGESETCIGNYWYQTGNGGDWWNLTHGEPFLLRSYCGSTDKLAGLITRDARRQGSGRALHGRRQQGANCISVRGKMERMRASLKLDYNEKRDFVGWGGEDFRRLNGMPGFTHYLRPGARGCRRPVGQLPRLQRRRQARPAAWPAPAAWPCCRTAAIRSTKSALPGLTTGCRAAVWADYNGDGKPDLLLATLDGPRLYTNLGNNTFRDDSHLLPRQPGWNLTSAAWIDYDGDGRPDLLLGNGYPRPAPLPQQGAGRQRRRPAQAGQVVLRRPVPEPERPGLRREIPAGAGRQPDPEIRRQER